MSGVKKDTSFRDRVATVDKEGKRIWIFPKKPFGQLYNLRSWVSLGYLLIFFVLPFIKINDHPVFLINIIERKFILFGQIFWPQDFFIFGLGMVVFIVFIALFTVVFGRVFCGWICPQTIFMEMVFRKIEYWIEGDMGAQKVLARAPWNREKMLKKGSKWIVFWLVSFLFANAFLSYIIGVDELEKIITAPVQRHIGGFIAIIIFTFIFFFVYSWFREQVCTVVCPYGRLQGVMLDKDSIVVAYDYVRGEQRGKFRKKEERVIGDCIDCYQCVQVCPTGIDIRNGTQMECVNCTACIDACNHMMNAVGLPRNLIRYASENGIKEGKPVRFNSKMKLYTAIMGALLLVLVYLLASRTEVGVNILRTPGQLFQKQENNQISNLYNYKLLNKTYEEKTIMLKPENFSGAIRLVGTKELKIPQEGYATGSMFIYLHQKDLRKRKTTLEIGVYEAGKKINTISTTFLGPFNVD